LLRNLIDGQKTSNARYVVEEGSGVLVHNPLEGLETVCHWLADGGKLLAQYSQNAKWLRHPQAAYHVAGLAWEAARRGPKSKAERLPDKI
jgi:UDP-N-acetylglucosamine:LPS N-acetylglucosamine transferase